MLDTCCCFNLNYRRALYLSIVQLMGWGSPKPFKHFQQSRWATWCSSFVHLEGGMGGDADSSKADHFSITIPLLYVNPTSPCTSMKPEGLWMRSTMSESHNKCRKGRNMLKTTFLTCSLWLRRVIIVILLALQNAQNDHILTKWHSVCTDIKNAFMWMQIWYQFMDKVCGTRIQMYCTKLCNFHNNICSSCFSSSSRPYYPQEAMCFIISHIKHPY